MKVKIKQLGKIITGKTPPTADLENFDGEVRFVTTGDLRRLVRINKSQRTLTQKGLKKVKNNSVHYDGISVLVACIGNGSCGLSAFLEGEAAFNQQINAITEITEHNPYYVYYLMASSYERFRIVAGKTSMFLLSKGRMGNMVVIIPDTVEEEERIGKLLWSYDHLIEKNKDICSLLEQYLHTLYDYWFVQFDFPDENGEPYHQSGGEMVHNEELARDIPVGWTVSSLNDTELFKVIKTGIKKFTGTKRYLATADVNDTDIDDGNPIDYDTRESRANMQPSTLSVWFAKMKDSRKHLFISAAATDFVEQTILSTGFTGLQCSESSFEYVSSYIANPLFEKWKNQIAHGATQKAINGDDLSKILIIEPPDDVLEQFHAKTQDIYQMLNNMQAENEYLAQLRDYLLPLLMSGQVIVNTENEED